MSSIESNSYKNFLYVNPLGEETDISYNNIGKYMKNRSTREAQVKDSVKKTSSNHLQIMIWSFVAAILILILLVLIRNIND